MKRQNCIMRILVFSIFMGYILPVFPQYTIKGLLQGTEQTALPYASVRLLRTDSTFVSGTVTDSLGCYRLNQVSSNDYLLAFSTIGYKPQIISVTVSNVDVTVPTVTLESDNVMLGEIVVKGSSFIRKEDRVLVIPDKQQVKHANTGYDLLYNLMIPSIDVNKRTGEVTTFGGSVSLYINGEKADYRDVQSLRPQDIERVEYYDVPTGKYANDVAAIDYITKQYKAGGYITLDGKQTIGYLGGDYNVGAKVSHGNTSYTVWGGYNMKEYDGTQTEKHEEIYFPEYSVNRDRTTGNANTRNNQQYVQFKVNNRTKKRNLSAQVSLVRDEVPENGSNDRLDYSGYYTQSAQSSEQTVSKGLQPSVKLFGNFSLPKKQNLEFSLKGAYAQNDYTRTYTEDERISLTDANEDMYSFEVTAKYNIKLKHKNTFGVQAFHFHRITSSAYSGDEDSWQHLWSGETLLFLNYTQKFSDKINLVLNPGVSILNYKLHDADLQKQYSLRLRSRLVYRPSKEHQWTFSANIGNISPDISFINNRTQIVDFLQVKRGNPELDNTKLYRLGITYSGTLGHLNMQINTAYEMSKDAVFGDYYIENSKLVNTYRSDADVHILMGQVGLSYRFSDNLRAKLSGMYAYYTLPNLSLTTNYVQGALDINYFWKDFSVNIYGKASNYQLNYNLSYIREPITYGASVSWSHKGWYLEAGTENPFTKHARYKEHADYGVYKYNQVQTSRINQQTGYVKVAYTFDFGRKTSRDKNDVDRNINSAIMKVD